MRPLKGTLQRSFGLDGISNLNYAEVIFRPPYTPAEVYAMEASGVAALGFEGVHFSITDHDEYAGNVALLEKQPDLRPRVGIAEELSLRFEGHLFHLGIVGLDQATVGEIHRSIQSAAGEARYDDLFEILHASGCLLILNHPLVHWNGRGIEDIPVGNLLRRYGWAVDAIEFNGMRGVEENAHVLELAREWRKPVVGGGDSHLLVPASALCVSQSSCMRDFIAEVKSGRSVPLIKPDYWAPLGWKLFLRVLCFIAHYRQIAEFRDLPVAEMLNGRRVMLDPIGYASRGLLWLASAIGLAR
jgi:hypothetical protein